MNMSCKKLIDRIKRSAVYVLGVPVIMVLTLAGRPAFGAIQMGGHLDFVLENGTTVRLFPEAVDKGPIRARPVWPRKIIAKTTPPGGDPCLALANEYKKRTTSKKAHQPGLHEVPLPLPESGHR